MNKQLQMFDKNLHHTKAFLHTNLTLYLQKYVFGRI